MKPRTLAKYALNNIDNGLFEFDCEERQTEAVKQLQSIIRGKPISDNNELDDPIVEFHAGVYIPNFDYPIVKTDENGEPIVWKEDGEFLIPGIESHIFKAVGLSGEKYDIHYMQSLSPFRNCIIKVDRYTDLDRASYALTIAVSLVLGKTINDDMPIKVEYDVLIDKWKKELDTHDKSFEEQQHKLYIKWLQKWISIHGKNPETHMKVLKAPKI